MNTQATPEDWDAEMQNPTNTTENWDSESYSKDELAAITKYAKNMPVKTRIVNPSELSGMSKKQKRAYIAKYSHKVQVFNF